MKKYFIRITSTILSAIVFTLSLPLHSFATDLKQNAESESVISADTVSEKLSSSNEVTYIMKEAEEKRDAASKSFLMSDGSYAAYVYGTDVHKKRTASSLK